MLTIRDVAEYCGVSTATVSKALNQESDISVETMRRVRAAARYLGYSPNAAARALKTRRAHNLGLLTQLHNIYGVSHEFVALVINAYQAEAERNGYDVTFVSKDLSGQTLSYVEHCHYRNFDGVALICADFYAPAVRELLDSGIPCVTVDCYDTQHASVMTDNENAFEELVEHVYRLGHRRLAMINDHISAIAEIRCNCFRRACDRRGLALPPGYVDTQAYYNDVHSAAEATKRLMSLPEPPTCIFYPDDISCIGGLDELKEQGLSVPGDVSVVGFDGIELSRFMRPRLTTYRQDMDAIGRSTLQALLDEIQKPRAKQSGRCTIPGELIARETAGRPANRVHGSEKP